MAKCPYCETAITEVVGEAIPITTRNDITLIGLSLMCPNCHNLLSVAVDPIALQNRILKEPADEMERRQQAAVPSPVEPKLQSARTKPKRKR
jgi:hypothetical protein